MKIKNITYLKPTPFAIIQDTREQTPLKFARSVPVIVRDLYPGDYSINGLTHKFAVERKSLDDLVNSLFGKKVLKDGKKRRNQDRLIEELIAMKGYEFKHVAVTSPRSHLEAHMYQSSVPPDKVINLISSIQAYTGILFEFYESPEQCARWLTSEALRYWRRVHGLSDLRPKLRADRLRPKFSDCPPPPKKPRGR